MVHVILADHPINMSDHWNTYFRPFASIFAFQLVSFRLSFGSTVDWGGGPRHRKRGLSLACSAMRPSVVRLCLLRTLIYAVARLAAMKCVGHLSCGALGELLCPLRKVGGIENGLG